MSGSVMRIERTTPRPGGVEAPDQTADGRFKLADPAKGGEKHHAEHAVFARTLDEVANLLARGYSLWMSRPGKRASLIAPGSLRIVRT